VNNNNNNITTISELFDGTGKKMLDRPGLIHARLLRSNGDPAASSVVLSENGSAASGANTEIPQPLPPIP
jgi:hypothetical protein